MTDTMMNLRTLVEKTPDADLLREPGKGSGFLQYLTHRLGNAAVGRRLARHQRPEHIFAAIARVEQVRGARE